MKDLPAPPAEHYDRKAPAYATFGNGLLARRVREALPPGGSVLDLGCASGGLLALLDGHAGRRVGLELSPVAAAAAREVADEVVCGALEDPDLPFPAAGFDVVVMADVLEHLVDPAAALARAVQWCRPGGQVVVSVPNIAHWPARATVLRGRWPSEPTGTFDEGHLRFFTHATIAALLREAALESVAVAPVVPALRNHLPMDRLPGRLAPRLERGWQAAGRRLPGLLGFQLVATGRRPGEPGSPPGSG